MTKKMSKLLSTIIAFGTVVALVGAGFCSWMFIETGEKKEEEKQIQVVITDEASAGYFRIDQQPLYVVLSEGAYSSADLFDGISFYSKKFDENDQEYIESDDKFIMTFVKPSQTNLDYLVSQGLTKLKLGLKLQISNEIDTDDGGNTLNPLSHYVETVSTFEYIYDSSFGCYTYYDESSTIPSSYLDALNIDKNINNNDENEVSYIIRLSKVIKYVSQDVKPLTISKYNQLVKDSYNQNWKIRISLYSEYVS
ncbi:MAG: hypothetical protein ACI4U5_03780 [Bacilli bacterium]